MPRSSCCLLNLILKTRLVIFLEHKHQHHNPWSMLPRSSTGIRQSFQQTKVNYWIDHIEKLVLIAKSQPQVAYSALIHGLQGKWTYALRSSQFTSETLEPLEASIRNTLIWALTVCSSSRGDIRHLMAFSARLGGLAIPNPTSVVTEFS